VTAVTGHVALVGLSGTGKSTVAPLLAARRGLACVDLDGVVVAQAGRSVAEIFAADGEARFRSLESDALARALDGPPAVLATGGGVVLDAANRDLLTERATVVWLQSRPGTLAARLSATDEERPLLSDGLDVAVERLSQMSAARGPLYTAVADVALEVDDCTAEEVVDAVDELLGALLHASRDDASRDEVSRDDASRNHASGNHGAVQ